MLAVGSQLPLGGGTISVEHYSEIGRIGDLTSSPRSPLYLLPIIHPLRLYIGNVSKYAHKGDFGRLVIPPTSFRSSQDKHETIVEPNSISTHSSSG